MSQVPTSAAGHRSTRARIGAVLAAVVTSFTVALGLAGPASAATGGQTGEWDVVAVVAGATPTLTSFSHTTESLDPVQTPGAWFAVGAGKVIDAAHDSTPVNGGGIRIENPTNTSKTVTLTFTVPAGVGLTIVNERTLQNVVSVQPAATAQTVTAAPVAVASGEVYHEHNTWTFSGASSSAVVGVSAQVSGASTSASYEFRF